MKQKGFSLIEVLIFITIISIFFVVTASISISMIRNTKINERKVIAIRYAEELLEWLRAEKDIDWNVFTTHAPTAGQEYCFNADPSGWINSPPCLYELDSLYKRTVKLTGLNTPPPDNTTYQVNVEVVVEWLESGSIYNVPLHTTFSIWERR